MSRREVAVHVTVQKVGKEAGKFKAPEDPKPFVQWTDQTDPAVYAAIVSAAARSVAPYLKDVPLRVVITTPDGRPWGHPGFRLENKLTTERYGFGTFTVEDPTNGRLEVQPWRD